MKVGDIYIYQPSVAMLDDHGGPGYLDGFRDADEHLSGHKVRITGLDERKGWVTGVFVRAYEALEWGGYFHTKCLKPNKPKIKNKPLEE